jgi:hypothetical protein
MALQNDFELDGVVHRDCYIRIHKIRTQQTDYEYFEDVNDSETPDIHQRLQWAIRLETFATVYVWADKASRDNRAQPIHYFTFDYDYDLSSPRNIYQQAYDSLKTAEQFNNAVDV